MKIFLMEPGKAINSKLHSFLWRGIGILLILAGLLATRIYSYLLFHVLAEFFSAVVAISIFLLVWNSRQFVREGYMTCLAAGYFCVGVIDLLHAAAYDGMGVFQYPGSNLATQLWMVARYTEAMTLLGAALVGTHRLSIVGSLVFFATVTGLSAACVFTHHFPECFAEGVGLTEFKKYSEYLISVILAASIIIYLARRSMFAGDVRILIVGSVAVTIASELSFTLYTSPQGPASQIGHFLKIISFYLMYKAIFHTGIVRPYAVMMQEMKHRKNLEREVLDISAREQRRIGQELHDSVGQQFAGILLMLRVLSQRINRKLPEEAPYVATIEKHVGEAMDQTRRLARGLSPMDWHSRDLNMVMQELGASTEEFGVECTIHRSGSSIECDKETATHLYRIGQEAIANAIKHGRARHIVLRITSRDSVVTFEVSSDGDPFPEQIHLNQGMGLRTIRYRMHLLGGSLNVSAGESGGTVVQCVFPHQPGKEIKGNSDEG